MTEHENLLDDFGATKTKQAETAPDSKKAPKQKSSAGANADAEKAPAKKTKAPAKKTEEPAKKTEKPAKKAPAKKTEGTSTEKPTKTKNQSKRDINDPDHVQTSTTTPAKKDKDNKKKESNSSEPRSAKTVHKVIPYVLGLFAIFLAICFLLNMICNMNDQLSNNPSEHLMGVFGYHLSTFLLGLFGPAVFVLPLLLFNLAIFWKKYVDNSMTLAKILISVAFLLIFASIIHTFCLAAYMGGQNVTLDACNWTTGELMDFGARTSGGGLFGGKIGYTLVEYLNIIGSLLVGFLLLIASLFYILGVTPRQIWRYFHKRSAQKKALKEKEKEQENKAAKPATPPQAPAVQRTVSRSEMEAEEAHRQAQMDEKIRKITKGGTATGTETGVEVVRSAPQKKNGNDNMAPMPMPRLDPTDGSRPFVPGDVGRRMNEESRAAAQAQRAPAAPQAAPEPINPAKNRDTAVDPIFPKSNESKIARRIPRQDRNFDLKNVFLDLDDSEEISTERQHEPVPPEVPIPATADRTPATVVTSAENTTTPQARPANTAPTATKPAPARPAAASPVTARPAPSQANQVAREQIQSQQTEFGLTSEEFEKLEAQNALLSGTKKPTATTTKPSETDTKKASAATAPTTPVASKPPVEKKYVFPPISYLQPGEPITAENMAEIDSNITQLTETLASFHVGIQKINFSCGPTVTRYEVILSPGVRVRSITNLADDIALALRSPGGVRIEAPIPGTNAVGIEIPNRTRSTIYLRDMIESKKFTESTSKLTACLGADIAGEPLVFDIAKMPHLLIAGTTGSGKSVCINCIITSLLYRVRPDEVKLILIDPKKVEFSIYKNIPHLMAPVVTLPKDAAGALQAAVEEMERRFEVFETVGVRDLKGYNTITKDDPDMPYIPHIVIIIDELADLMMTARNEVETAICRIAQKARAAGMHLIIGTQRPSADVVTGLIKANVPSSIAFAVKSQIDSRVILDHGGAEALTGRGDMLFVPIGAMRDTRVQGAFVDDKEVEKICEFLRATNGTAVYDERFTAKLKELAAQCGNKGKNADDIPPTDGEEHGDDPKYNDAVRVAIEEGRISTSLLQRKLGVGYSRAAKLIDRMQTEGIVSPPDGSKPRSILITPEQYLERFVDNAGESADSDTEA